MVSRTDMSPREVVAAVRDPEIPALTIEELGILRDVRVDAAAVTVTITPTYSGCPAMDAIRADIQAALRDAGYDRVEVVTELRPAWTTDWISESGRAKLAAAGIVPPEPASLGLPPATGLPTRTGPPTTTRLALTLRCTHCGSPDTQQLSRFGSTACKSLWRCRACAEPFEHFKAL
jgi:ring-1,2-phenylacetyl-CoA epoxidase subunit PaaD